jgi:hypothetical protein
VRFYGNEYLNHPDHRAVASAALDAVFPSSETSAIFPELLAEGLPAHKVRQVFINGSLDPDVFVDIGATLGAKCRALKAHRSQVGKGEWVNQLLKAWALRDGKRAAAACATPRPSSGWCSARTQRNAAISSSKACIWPPRVDDGTRSPCARRPRARPPRRRAPPARSRTG